MLALRRLKARESARPRTRPGRDLLPSSFLHPVLSLSLTFSLPVFFFFHPTILLFQLLSFFVPRVVYRQLRHDKAVSSLGSRIGNCSRILQFFGCPWLEEMGGDFIYLDTKERVFRLRRIGEAIVRIDKVNALALHPFARSILISFLLHVLTQHVSI